MGEHDVSQELDEVRLRSFMQALLRDVRALELMLQTGSFEDGGRIGAEQEMFLVDAAGRPAPKAMEILDGLDDERFVTELARFNLEANLTPRDFEGDCLSKMEQELQECVDVVRRRAEPVGAQVLLTGILSTLRQDHLGLDNMTPNPRYHALNNAVRALKGGSFHFKIKGLDELELQHDNVMVEAANTSFQLHYQVGANVFARMYNLSQAVAAPVLAAAVNSPLLLGRRLWQETRVAVFQQSIDARSQGQQVRGHRPRVDFGERWVNDSVLEIFREDIARFRVVLAAAVEEDSLEVLSKGGVPGLNALRMHNGTVYRWNRPCYGVAGGKPHLRVEARALPAGPSVLDEMANAAFHFGLLAALGREFDDISKVMSFDDAKSSFFAAARHGLSAQLSWIGGRTFPASELILDELLPSARAGLAAAGIDSGDIDRYLGVLEERVKAQTTGSQWTLKSLENMSDDGTQDQRLRAIAQASVVRQAEGAPVHEWDLATLDEAPDWSQSYRTVGQFMTTDIFTVRPGDLVDLAACLMTWEHIRHVPVEDDEGHIVGLVSHRALLRLMAEGMHGHSSDPITVGSIMRPDPVTVSAETRTLDAIAIMRREKVGCLPVTRDGRLVGIVTERDLVVVAGRLLEQHLQSDD